MNTSNTNTNNNNFTETIFSTKLNNKKDRKSHNYKAIKKTEDRDGKVEALISELPNKYQKQLQSLKTGPTIIAATQKRLLPEKSIDRVGPKTNFAREVRDIVSDNAGANEDAWNEYRDARCEQRRIDYDAMLKEEHQENIRQYHLAYAEWQYYKECTDEEDWCMFTECNLKNNFHQYETIIGLESKSNQSNQSNTRTMDEYEMDELQKNATKNAIEEAWLRTSDTLLTVEECVASWREKTLEYAVKMEAAKTKRDAAIRAGDDFAVAAAINDAVLNDAAIKAKEFWLNEQFDAAVAMDSVVSLKDPKFLKYMEWLNENDTYNDLRYVMWSHREYCDNVEADDSKYDELPLHERYTWHSDEEDDDEDDDNSVPDLITYEEDLAAIKAKTIAETIAKEFAADLADDYSVNVYDLKSLMLDEDTWDRWDVEKVARLKHNISEYERVHLNGRR